MLAAPEEIAATIRRHFAFLLERGFVPDPEPNPKDVRRAGFRYITYRGERWAVEVYLEYREGYYDVRLVPLEHGEPRKVPFGCRTRWGLEQYLKQVLGIRDKEFRDIRELTEAASPLTGRVTVEFADQFFALYAAVLDRHLEEIVASSYPPIQRD